MNADALDERARTLGIAPVWTDNEGRRRDVAPDTLHRLCEALADDGATRDAPLLTGVADTWLALPGSGALRCIAEDGDTAGPATDSATDGDGAARRVRLPSTPGYYRIDDGRRTSRVAVAPACCPGVAALLGAHGERVPMASERRAWGLAVQAYALWRHDARELAHYGLIGDFAEEAARHGAHALALSPLHALFAAAPERRSPYAPSSRLFFNVMHVEPPTRTTRRVEAAPPPLIDWPRASRRRLHALREADAALGADADAVAAFETYCAERGGALLDHARFEAFQCAAGLPPDWRRWPPELRDPRGTAVQELAARHVDEVRFHARLQWLAERQLADAQRRARAAGMAIGLIADLAVGADPGGSHAWSRQREMITGASIGAPPDALAPQGQVWGLGAFSPVALRARGYEGFVELLRAAMRHAGGVRIDHVMALRRLWLVPDGLGADDGAYVEFPFDDLLNLVALEAWRHDCLVIGEDLGTVPEGLSRTLAERGVLGMSVLGFERADGGGYRAPSAWRPRSVAMTSTHDLPTLAGWWQGEDLRQRTRIGLLDDAALAAARQARESDRVQRWHTVRGAQAGDGGLPDADAWVDAAIAHVAGAASDLALVPVEDVLGLVDAPNLPGTVDEHPNWRRRLPRPVDALLDGDAARRRLQSLRRARL